jgi:hypothetical protein
MRWDNRKISLWNSMERLEVPLRRKLLMPLVCGGPPLDTTTLGMLRLETLIS